MLLFLRGANRAPFLRVRGSAGATSATPTSVRRGMDGCDVVVHLAAWTLSGSVTHEQAEPINIGGTPNVSAGHGGHRLRATGVRLLGDGGPGPHADHPQRWLEHEKLDPAYGLVYEWHKAQAEEMYDRVWCAGGPGPADGRGRG